METLKKRRLTVVGWSLFVHVCGAGESGAIRTGESKQKQNVWVYSAWACVCECVCYACVYVLRMQMYVHVGSAHSSLKTLLTVNPNLDWTHTANGTIRYGIFASAVMRWPTIKYWLLLFTCCALIAIHTNYRHKSTIKINKKLWNKRQRAWAQPCLSPFWRWMILTIHM